MTAQAARRSPRAGQQAARFAVRRRTPVPRRRRLWRLGLALALAGALGAGAWWLLTAETFDVSRVQSGSYRFTAKAELDSVLSLFLGRNIWTLRRQEVADALQDLDWVRDLHVSRRLPDTIEVDFREWRPLAVLAPADSGAVVWPDSATGAAGVAAPDSGGAPLPVAADEPPGPILVLSEDGRVLSFPGDLVLPALPTLVGFQAGPAGTLAVADPKADAAPDSSAGPPADPTADPSADATADSGAAAGPHILALFAAVEDAGLEALCPVDFVVAGADGYAIVLQERQGTLLVGREDFTARLRRYMFAREHLQPGAEVDLRFADRVTVKTPPQDERQGAGRAAGADKVRSH